MYIYKEKEEEEGRRRQEMILDKMQNKGKKKER